MLFSTAALVFALPLLRAAVVPSHHADVSQSLPAWYQEPGHPVHSLFRRAPDDGTVYPVVGSPEWMAGFPRPGAIPDPSSIPQNWVTALNQAVAAGKVPDIPRSSNTPNTSPVYPDGVSPTSPQICSATYRCRIPGDFWDAPDGVLASSFDDGPLPPTSQLMEFLKSRNLSTTHFMIGSNILFHHTEFLDVFNAGHDIAVHTWSHPYMTTLSNIDILGQLGWTMQLIHNSTGGRVPRFWRPPYGDSDMRVRSIAKEVFGLDTVIWNSDSSDWSAQTQADVVRTVSRYLTGSKAPGLVLLGHTNSAITVGGFIAVYPAIVDNEWSFRSTAEVFGGGSAYQNANSSTSDVSRKGILLNDAVSSSSSVLSSSSTVPPTPSSVYSTSFRRASPTPSSTRNQNSAISWLRPSDFALSLTVILSGLSVLVS